MAAPTPSSVAVSFDGKRVKSPTRSVKKLVWESAGEGSCSSSVLVAAAADAASRRDVCAAAGSTAPTDTQSVTVRQHPNARVQDFMNSPVGERLSSGQPVYTSGC